MDKNLSYGVTAVAYNDLPSDRTCFKKHDGSTSLLVCNCNALLTSHRFASLAEAQGAGWGFALLASSRGPRLEYLEVAFARALVVESFRVRLLKCLSFLPRLRLRWCWSR